MTEYFITLEEAEEEISMDEFLDDVLNSTSN